jgi:membrane protein
MAHSLFETLKTTFKRFLDDKCGNFAIIISYFAFLCSIPLVALFAFITTKILGSSELVFRSLNIFSDEFFGSLVAGSFLFSNLIYSINFIFRANYQKSFFYNRLIEYLIMFVMGIIMLASLSITAIWTAIHRSMNESTFIANNINPEAVSLMNNFFLQYLIPFTLTFFVFFSIYKFIPEVRVNTKAALIAALIGAFLWEVFKRIFAFYVAHISPVGVVLSRLLEGTLTSIIFFLVWISVSLFILLWGAELAAVMNERIHEKAA